ncbi:MAG: hypothetical protein AAGE94_01225 [Acidobacteriota bacterium]
MSRERVREIVAFLEEAGWSPRPTPLRVGDLVFEDFAALLEGPGDEHQLIVVLDNGASDSVRVVRALVRGLERTGSTRPVTLIALATPGAAPPRVELARLCRTVVVPAEVAVADALRSLAPLVLPEPLAPIGSMDVAFDEFLAERADDPVCRALLAAGRESTAAVESTLQTLLDDELAPLGLDADRDEEDES